jgi:hypothetical protein
LLALVAGVGSDVFEHSFWAEHALLAGLASNALGTGGSDSRAAAQRVLDELGA